jgi:hypothetical protein
MIQNLEKMDFALNLNVCLNLTPGAIENRMQICFLAYFQRLSSLRAYGLHGWSIMLNMY